MTTSETLRRDLAPSMHPAHREHIVSRLVHAMGGVVDAVVALSPENSYYVTGYPSMFAYQPAANVIAAIQCRDGSPPVLVATELENYSVTGGYGIECRTIPIWMGIEDPYNTQGAPVEPPRANGIGTHAVLRQVVEVLGERGVDPARIAVEVSALDHAGHEFLLAELGVAHLKDAAPVFDEARRIKSSWEVDQLRAAVAITEQAITDTCVAVQEGTTLQEVHRTFRERAYAHGAEGVRLAMITLGLEFGPTAFGDGMNIRARRGEVVKFDVGAVMSGYGADLARTFSLGPPRADVRRRYDALRSGYDFVLANAAPGVSLGALFDGCMERIHAAGLPQYSRGHVGHSLGLARQVEEWPYVAHGADLVLEPGMVMCFETPYYAIGVGGLQCEDVVLVTKDGIEVLNELSRDLVELPA